MLTYRPSNDSTSGKKPILPNFVDWMWRPLKSSWQLWMGHIVKGFVPLEKCRLAQIDWQPSGAMVHDREWTLANLFYF